MSPDLLQALRAIHQPRDWADVEAAKRRHAFEELLLLQLKLLLRREIERTPRSEADLEGTRVTQRDMMEAGRDVLGFRLTAAQDRVLTEVCIVLCMVHASRKIVVACCDMVVTCCRTVMACCKE